MEFPTTPLRCSIHIDLYALERNLGRIRNFLPRTGGYIALVAADAFGIGIEAACARLMMSGADAFAVTNLSEAVRVRRVGPGWPVIVLSASIPGEERFFVEHSIIPTLAGVEEIGRFERAAREAGVCAAVHMKLPSAAGFASIPDVPHACEMLERLLSSDSLRLSALCVPGTGTGAPEASPGPDPDFLRRAASLLSARRPGAFIHHGDVFDPSVLPEGARTSLRAGLVLFGVKPGADSVLSGFSPEQVLAFRSAVSHIKRLPAGSYVGYSKTFRLARDSKIALISAGYGDGLARSAGGRASVIVRDTLLPVVGVVSMDQAAVDATALPQIRPSDEAVIVGSTQSHSITIEKYCADLGVSPAEALTSITQRVARIYRQSNA